MAEKKTAAQKSSADSLLATAPLGTNVTRPLGVDPGYKAAPQIMRGDADALGRIIVDDKEHVSDPSKQVHRKDAVMQKVGPNGATYGGGPTQYTVQPRDTQYVEGDQYTPNGLPPNAIRDLQRQMIDSGLLPKTFKNYGLWDPQSTKAYEKAMGYANQAGVDVKEIFGRWKDYGVNDADVPGKVLTVQNPEDVAAVVKSASTKILGRTLSKGEIDQLVAGYQNIDRSAQEAANAAAATAQQGNDAVAPQPISADTYAANQIAEKNKGEAKFFSGIQRMNTFYSMLGEAI